MWGSIGFEGFGPGRDCAQLFEQADRFDLTSPALVLGWSRDGTARVGIRTVWCSDPRRHHSAAAGPT